MQRIVCLSIGLLVCALSPDLSRSQTGAPMPGDFTAKKKLLLLHSYYKGFEWTDLIDKGIDETLRPFEKDLSIYTEYMDLKRFPEHSHIASLREVYRIKYSKVKFDAILCTDDHAFQFLLDFRDELFPGTPVVFCGVNDFDPAMLKGHHGFTGKQERLNVGRTIEIALGIDPALKRIAVVADTTPTGVGTLKELGKVFPEFADRVHFEIYDDITMADLRNRIGRLSQGDAVLLLNFNRDKEGNDFQHSETIALLQDVSKVPIYGLWDFYVGRGILGGVITSGIEIGRVAGRQTLRVLAGERAEAIPIETDFPQKVIFDNAVMKRFGIRRDQLPAEATLINLPMTFYRVNKKLIWTLSGLLVFLFLTTLVLILSIVQRRRAQKALSKAHRALLVLNRCKQAMINAGNEQALVEQIASILVETGRYRQARVIPDDVVLEPDWITLPLMIGHRREGALSVQGRTTETLDEEERDLLDKVAENLSYGILMQRMAVERKKAEQELLLSNEKLSMLLQSLPIVPFTCEPANNRIAYVSPVIESMTGYPSSCFTGDEAFWLDRIHPADRDGLRTLSVGPGNEGVLQRQYRFQCGDGSYRWFNDIRHVVCPDEGAAMIVGVWQDITKEKILQEEADARLQQLIRADKLASLGEIVAGVAHEINNPNAFISYNVPLLRESWNFFRTAVISHAASDHQWRFKGMSPEDLVREMDEILDDIAASSQRINQVVCDLKDFSKRDDEGDRDRQIQVNDVVKKTLNIVGAQIRKSFVEYTVHLAPQLPLIQGHFTKLEQIVTNLVVNASQSVPVGKRAFFTIRTEFLEHRKCVAIHVEDTGSGISPVVGDRIFEAFFTTRQEQGGTGLGLSVSRRLVDEHDGAISFVSRPGVGTRFTVYLPLANGKTVDIRPSLLWIGGGDRVDHALQLLHRNFPGALSVVAAGTEQEVWDALYRYPELRWVAVDLFTAGLQGPDILARIAERAPLLMRAFYGDRQQMAAIPSEAAALADVWLMPPLETAPAGTLLQTEGVYEDLDRGRRANFPEVVKTSVASAQPG
ncbi:MAG: PAS domain-containing protein [Deltaproteobacteria bacterium]|nr:PAS domain-containing protein [Deltaproteobacteria bacterium]